MTMIDTIPESGIPWNREQTEVRLAELEDNIVDLTQVLSRFTPDHIHWTQGGMPLLFNLIPQILRLGTPLSESVFNAAFEGYLGRQSLPGKILYGLYYPKKGLVWPVEKALRFREIDFKYTAELISNGNPVNFFISTSRIEGARSLYQAFAPSITFYRFRGFDYLVYEKGQQLINAFLDARV